MAIIGMSVDQQKNYYQLLHVQADAPIEVIRSSYRAMMQQLKMHPDLGGDHEAAALVNEAYNTLSNPDKREQYDQQLKQQANKQTQQNESAPAQIQLDPSIQCLFCWSPHNLGQSIQRGDICNTCHSPLFLASRDVLDPNGQRLIQRIKKQWQIIFYVDWPSSKAYSATTNDVSLNGIQIISPIALEVGQIIKISGNTLDAIGQVANQRESHSLMAKRWKVGIEFLTLRFHKVQGAFLKVNA